MTHCSAAPTATDCDDLSALSTHTAVETKPIILFVASTSHSGSTLLDLMLNAHPEIASVGELKQLGRYARSARVRGRIPRCTCGALVIGECPFWSIVGSITTARLGRGLGELNVEDYADVASFDGDNAVLFDAISMAAQKRYIVDSSKHLDRLERLLANPAIEVFPIFLVRDPKGQICSALGKNKKKNARSEKDTYGLVRLIGNYVATNRRIHKLIKNCPHAVVRYEELVKDPEKVLTPLMQQLGLGFHPLQLEWATQVSHNVSGNRMRRGTSSELKLDEKWRDDFSLSQKLVIDASTFPGRYPFVKFGLS